MQYFVSGFDGNVFAAGAEGLRFKSRAGQIGHSVCYRCDIFLKETVLLGDGPH